MTPALSSPEYPRTYRLSRGWTAFLVVAGTAAAVGGCVAGWSAATAAKTFSAAMTLFAVSAAAVIFGIYCILSALKSYVVLFADRIEDHGVFATRELQRQQIVGRRFQKTRNSPGALILEPRDGARKVKIALVLKTDEAFREWMESLPDLDAQELKASEQEIAGGAEGSSVREERLHQLASGKKLAMWLKAAAYVIAGWAWINPRPYGMVMTLLIVLPWVAVMIVGRSDGIFRIDQRKNDAHPSVGTLIIVPGLVLALRVMTDMHVLAWKPALYLSIGIGVVLWIAAAKVDASLRARPASLVIIFLVMCAYGYGAGMEINRLLDHSTASVYSARVVGKHISSGRRTSYDLTVSAPELDALNGNISVPASLYRSVEVGDSVCASVRRGALNVAWFVVQQCGEGVSSAAD